MSRAGAALLALAVTVGTIAGSLVPAPFASDPTGVPTPATTAGDCAGATFNPFSFGMPANEVVGQPSFVTARSDTGPGNLSSDLGSATFDNAGDLWVADSGNNRVLEYVPPFSIGMNASVAIGQGSLNGSSAATSPSGLSEPAAVVFDGEGDLWVADSGNNRILEFVPPFTTGMEASRVLGQPSFSTGSGGTSASNLADPSGLAFNASGALFVADAGNNRVVAFDPPFSDGMNASLVLGQRSFSTAEGATTRTNLSNPTGVALDRDGDVWVADSGNDRVVGFRPPLLDGEPAMWLLGQENFTLRNETLPDGLEAPRGIAFDQFDDLWVADGAEHNRVLEYDDPSVATGGPIGVIGQRTLGGIAPGTSRTNLTSPSQPVFDPSGDLWVVDSGNGRVLEYVPTSYSVTANESGLPAGTLWSATVGGTAEAAVAPNPILFALWNGTYPLSIGPVAGYVSAGSSCPILVTGQAISFDVPFSSSPTVSTGPPPGELELGIYVLLALVLALVGLLLWQRRRGRRPGFPRSTSPSGRAPPTFPPPAENGPSGAPGERPGS